MAGFDDNNGGPSLKCKLATGGGILTFIAVLFVIFMVSSIHTIEEKNMRI